MRVPLTAVRSFTCTFFLYKSPAYFLTLIVQRQVVPDSRRDSLHPGTIRPGSSASDRSSGGSDTDAEMSDSSVHVILTLLLAIVLEL